ncbi:MAG: tetratricopeptide repeat protein [Acidobacteriia bacterium]|nr:tetratricopeptide repeat protein [Terriglobia bacterium]
MRRGCVLFLAVMCGCLAASRLAADYIKGASYFAQGKYDLAIKEYEEELRLDPAYVQGHYIVGLCYARLQNYDKAIAALSQAQALDKKDFQIALALAQAYFDAHRYADLKEALNTASLNAQNPADLNKLKFLSATALFNQEDYTQALPELHAALASNPKDAVLLSEIGIAQFHLKNYDEAIAALTKAVAEKPDDAQTALFLGESYFARALALTPGRERTMGFTEGFRLGEKWAVKQPQNFDAVSLAGRAALALKNYSQAESFLKRAVQLQPDSAVAQFSLGQAYAFEGKLADAESALTKASASLSNEPALYSILGFVLEKENKLEAAQAAYEKANSLSPSKETQSSLDRVKQKIGSSH